MKQNETHKGEYRTRQRELILDCLRENRERHLNIAEITEILREKGERVGQTTVYRTLERLADEGIAHKYSVAGENLGACYQFADDCRGCYHLVCSKCGKLIHIECGFMDELAGHIYTEHRFTLDPFKTVLYGVCGECSEKQSDGEKEKDK